MVLNKVDLSHKKSKFSTRGDGVCNILIKSLLVGLRTKTEGTKLY